MIVSIDGRPASDGELKAAKERAGFGNTIELELFRNGRKETRHVKVGIQRH